MKTLDHITLKDNERQAIISLKEAIAARCKGAELILFGSKVRGDSNDESDIDVLILLGENIDDYLREEIFDIAYKIELAYDVVFGIIVQTKLLWYSDNAQDIPLYQSIQRDGVIAQ